MSDDVINIGIVMIDPNGSVVLWNRWMEEKSLLSKSEVIGKNYHTVFSEIKDQHFFRVVDTALKNGNASIMAQSIHKAPLPLYSSDQLDKIPQSIEVKPVKYDADDKYHCLIQITDISAAVKREELLRSKVFELSEANNRIEIALDSGKLTTWDWHVDTQEIYHGRLMEMLGYEHAGLHSYIPTWQDLVHPEDWTCVKKMMCKHLKGEIDQFDCEFRLLTLSGDWMWTYGRAKVVTRDDEGRAHRVIGINQDITRRKLAEIEAKYASEAAIESSKVKADFLSNMSHELKTPLNGIMGVHNLLKQSDMSIEQLEYIDVAHRSAESLLGLIENVLDFSKLGANSVELEKLSFDPEFILKDVIKLLSSLAKDNGVALDYIIENDGLKTITTDPGRLRQVLYNLVGNAIKFTTDGFVQIRLLTTVSNEHVLFEVEDNGVGIPKERQDAIFGAFVQADNSTTRKYGGTGLGLGISKQLIELMGGQIMVESEVDKGSTFSFTIEDQAELIHNPESYSKEQF
ncbi:MAG: PAS domain-containing sensor histidine kinase [Gammaproteobacteria bacterium]